MNWKKLFPNLSFTVENKIGNLHKIRMRHKHTNEIFHYFKVKVLS